MHFCLGLLLQFSLGVAHKSRAQEGMFCDDDRDPGEKKSETKYNDCFDDRRYRGGKQRVLKPDDEDVMQQIKAVGIGRKRAESP